MSVVLVN